MSFPEDLDRLTGGGSWSAWVPLDGADRKPTPLVPGLYEVLVAETGTVEYVAQAGPGTDMRGLRERMADLQAVCSSPEMPYADPHPAAPCLWALCQVRCSLQVRFFETPDLDEQERRGLESVERARIRAAQRRSPLANFGGMPTGCSRPGTRREGKLGTFAPFSLDSLGVGARWWPAAGDALGEYPWSGWQPLEAPLPSGPGLYRLGGGHGTAYVGGDDDVAGAVRAWRTGLRLKASARYKALRRAGPVSVSFTTVPVVGRSLLERLDHVVASVILTERRVPDAQYLDEGRSRALQDPG